MQRTLFPATGPLSSVVRYFHVETDAHDEVLLPASPSPIVLAFTAGGSAVEQAPGFWHATPDAFVCGPLTRATRYRTVPGTGFVCALLRPGQFAQLFAAPLHLLTDRQVPLDTLSARPVGARAFAAGIRAMRPPSQRAQAMADWLALEARDREGQRAPAWPLAASDLLADPRTLALRCGLGLRQFKRRFLCIYGHSLRQMQRQARFHHVLARLMAGQPVHGGLAGLALDHGYYDQAHLARDFRNLAGVSIGRLASTGDVDPSLSAMRYDRNELHVVLDQGSGPSNVWLAP